MLTNLHRTAGMRGFTLMEVMVVLVLIGILTSFAVLSVGHGPRERLAEETRRLTAVLELQQQEAILSGELRGVQFSRTGYAILQQGKKGAWQPLAAEATFSQHKLPEDLTLGLWIENRPVSLKTVGAVPHVLLLASGEATEFTAVFELEGEPGVETPKYRVAGDAMGRLTTGEVKP